MSVINKSGWGKFGDKKAQQDGKWRSSPGRSRKNNVGNASGIRCWKCLRERMPLVMDKKGVVPEI